MNAITKDEWLYKTAKPRTHQIVINIDKDLKILNDEYEEARKKTLAPCSVINVNPVDDFSAIPEEMKKHNCWVCWSKDERSGKTTKVPKNPKTGGMANATLSATWVTFSEAKDYYRCHTDDIDGVGYVFTEGNGVVGIDIDHCVEDGEIISDEIHDLVDRCGSYVELSPSGTGIHMYVKGKWKETGGRKNNKIGADMAIEVYPSKRYFTVTGNAFGKAKVLTEDQELLDEIYDRYFAAKEESLALVPARLEDLGVEPEHIKRLQERLENRHGWLALLWEGRHTKESESEADMALICRLLKICDGDEEAVKKLFMASPFAQRKDADHRKKLDREDYWRISIDNAMDYLEQHPDFEQHDELRPLLRFDADNDGNASMLFEYMDGNVRYCKEQKVWLIYKDCWVNDAVDQELKEKAVEMYRKLKTTVKAIADERCDDEDERNKVEACLKKKIKSFDSPGGINSVITYAQSYKEFTVAESQLDTHDDMLAADNGIINLRTGELLPFDRQLYITRQTPVKYNPDAPEPECWLRFMNDTSGGNSEWVDYMQLVLGYCITGCTNHEAFFVFHGETGNNGKSTLLKTLMKLFPQHVISLNKVALEESKSSTELNSSLASAKSYRMVIMDESDGKRQLNDSLVRNIASGESPNIRDLYEKTKSYTPHYKLVFCGNFIPKFNWQLYANLRRLCLIPFNNTIADSKVDIHLDEKLRKEAEGILAWIVKGAMRSFKENVTKNQPAVIKEYTRTQMYKEDPIFAFCEDEIDITDNPEDTVQAKPLFERYNDWRGLNGLPQLEYKKAISSFGNRLKTLGYVKGSDSKNNVVYIGIRLRQDEHRADESEEVENQCNKPDISRIFG